MDQAASQNLRYTPLLYQELPVEVAEQILGVARRSDGKWEV
jgi:hypothetical protein